MSDWPTITPGNAWAAAQGRFLSVYRTRKHELPCTRMWLRAWPRERPRRRWWSPFYARWDLGQILRLARGTATVRGKVALFEDGSPVGTAPVLVVVTGEETNLGPGDLVAVDVYGTVAPSGHFVIDAGGWGDLFPDSNPERPGQRGPKA